MRVKELEEPLLEKEKFQPKKELRIKKNQFSLIYQKMMIEADSINESSSEEERLVKSDIQKYEAHWEAHQIQEKKENFIQSGGEEPFNEEIENYQQQRSSPHKRKQNSVNSLFRGRQSQLIQPTVYKDLNARIFALSTKVQNFLYYFNFIFNILFRIAILTVIIQLYSEKQRVGIASALMALEIATSFLYFTAMVKLIYTKSFDVGVYFQKAFFQKPYSDIQLDRILRKHFTVQRILQGTKKLFKPATQFNQDIKIKVLRQQIFKRIELILVFIPYIIFFSRGLIKFSLPAIGSDIFLACSITLELIRFCGHYLIIYILS